MSISLIVAAAENNTIGKDNALAWSLPNDMKFFKNTTWGMPVIMGRKTFESFGKPLTARTNIVISRLQGWRAEGTITAVDLPDALKKAAETNAKEIFIIGGGDIFKQSIELAHRIYMTRVHGSIDGDVFFPAIDEDKWQLVSNEDHVADEKHLYAYSFQTWERI